MEQTLNYNKRYTFADYLTWIDDKRRELYEGFINLMSAPTRYHQKVSGTLYYKIYTHLLNHKCDVYSAPFDVRLPKNGEKNDSEIYTVVQPDIVVVCDPKKLDDKGCLGAPDLVVEITSKSTRRKDLKDKFQIYEKAGVKEYWIAFPETKTLQIFFLNNEKFEFDKFYVEGDKATSKIFSQLEVDVEEIFKDDLL